MDHHAHTANHHQVSSEMANGYGRRRIIVSDDDDEDDENDDDHHHHHHHHNGHDDARAGHTGTRRSPRGGGHTSSSSDSAEEQSEDDSEEEEDDDEEDSPRASVRRPRTARRPQQQRRPQARSARPSKSRRHKDDDSEDSESFGPAIRFSTRARATVDYTAVGQGLESEGEDSADETESAMMAHEMEMALEPQVPTIEDILDHRDEPLESDMDVDGALPRVVYLVKWKGKSYLHNTWEDEASLRHVKGHRKVLNYKSFLPDQDELDRLDADAREERTIQIELHRNFLQERSQVERIIDARQVSASDAGDMATDDGDGAMPEETEYLCKWKRLDYANCTWESVATIAPAFQKEIDEYYAREHSQFLPGKGKVYGPHDRRPRPTSKVQPSYIDAGELREYQLLGMNWLLSLWSKNENGILADEMGLGKTVQTISALSAMVHDFRNHGPFLIVVPLSVIHSWQSEFAKWAPKMNLVVYVGNRQAREVIREHEFYQASASSRKPRASDFKPNVLLTSFEMILKDETELKAIKWAYLAVDEAHRLKNANSQLYEVLKGFRTANRLLITGTPLQNSIAELNALLQFLMPEKFSDLEDFDVHGTDDGGMDKIKMLHSRLKDHMLRRLKRDVETSLPNKSERILRVDLAPMQLEFYKSILSRNFTALSSNSRSGPKLSLLNIAMELKKVSNHPFLISGAEDMALQGYEKRTTADMLRAMLMNSGKMLLLDKLLTRLKVEGHRVLIFSQMVRMLDIISDYMAYRGFRYQRLDGGTAAPVRQRSVEQFNAPDSTDFAFLLSTRAGGLGLNLTTADTVIIFDSDWNPQNDLQAMARAHRIGQTKTVHVYRLVSKDTIEEQIIERAKRKMILEYCIIKQMDTSGRHVLQLMGKAGGAGGAESASKGLAAPPDKLSREEMSALLKFGAQDLFAKDSTRTLLDDLDLDKILEDAEGQEASDRKALEDIDAAAAAQQGDATNGGSEHAVSSEFLNQFSVVDFGLDQLKWEDIIPEEDRRQAEEAEKQKELEAQRQAEEAITMRKYRKALMSTPTLANGTPAGPADAAAAAAATAAAGSGKRKRTKPAPKIEDASRDGELSISETRALHRAILHFGDIETRMDDIVADSGLEAWDVGIVKAAAVDLISAARDGIDDPNPAHFQYKGIKFHPATLITRIRDLEGLGNVLRRFLNSRTAEALSEFRIHTPLKGVVGWAISWTPREDAMLVVGIYRHGYGNWKAIHEDASLGLSSKMFLNNEAGKLPRQEHLARRADYVIQLLNSKLLPQNRQPTIDASFSRSANSGRKRARDADDADGSDDLSDAPSDDAHQPAKTATKRRRQAAARAPSSSAVSSGTASRPKRAPVAAAADRPSSRTARPPSPASNNSSLSDASDSDYNLDLCKSIMKPVKQALIGLRNAQENKDVKAKVEATKQQLAIIGKAVIQQNAKVQVDLWKYVAEWFPNGPKWTQVKALSEKLNSSSNTPDREQVASPRPQSLQRRP
ncbi:SNF2 family N-terminal domain-containing protein [Blastocladiella britannica]|nr:SNF2 family N-terminal domain-containing protein [Blastocladiella britannica]